MWCSTSKAGRAVTFNDARRFGVVDLWPTADLEAHRLLAGLGPEPLGNGFDGGLSRPSGSGGGSRGQGGAARPAGGGGARQHLRLRGAVAGADLAAAPRRGRDGRRGRDAGGRGPRRARRTRSPPGARRLRDYRQADGELGYFQHSFAVYGREGEPCRRSDGTIERVVQAARSSFYCPACQT